MRKKEVEKYWENEEGETIEFGKHFMRCFDKAGKLQFGKKFYDPSKYSLQGTTQGNGLTGGVPPVRFSM